MKIAVYKDTLSNQRGADRAVKNFAVAMAARGHDVRLFEKYGLADALEDEFDAVIATGSNEAIDLDNLGYFEREGRAKTILQLHLAPKGFFKWQHPIRNWKIRRAFDKFDAVQLLCSSYAEDFHAIAPHPRITVIGNYTDRVGGSSRAEKVILYPAASLTNVKNQILLIRAFATMAADFPDWQVRLLGKDTTDYAVWCRKLIERTGLSGQVKMIGFTDDLDREYSRAAFIAFPSKLEGFPLAILEAAQYALPTLVVDSLPGANDIVKNDETGLVVPDDVFAFAAGLRKLMMDAAYCRSLGLKCREYCRTHYSRTSILDQWEAFLTKIAIVD